MAPSITVLGARVRSLRSPLFLAATFLLAGCGDSDPTGSEPDPDVAPFVGNWEAETFDVTNLANQEETFHVVEAGSFTLNVQPSGFYTATLYIEDFPPNVENGQLSVVAGSVRLSPTTGPSITAAFEFEGPNRVVLDGPTEFDFNFDGEAEAATAHIVLERS